MSYCLHLIELHHFTFHFNTNNFLQMKMMKTYKRTSYTNGLVIFSKDKDLLNNLMQLPQIYDFRKVHVLLYDVYDGSLQWN